MWMGRLFWSLSYKIMKKFYSVVSVEEKSGGFVVLLDGKGIKTPGRVDMVAPTRMLADAIVLEWAGQGEVIVPDSMPLTQILSTRIDRVSREREAMTGVLMKYLDTDLVCYFAEEPADLVAAQEAAWRPVLEWFEGQFGAALAVTDGLVALSQDEGVKRDVLRVVEAMGDDVFTVFQLVSGLAGSVVLGLMFVQGDIGAEAVFGAARVEERYNGAIANEEVHGADPAAAEKDAVVLRDLTAAEKYLVCLG